MRLFAVTTMTFLRAELPTGDAPQAPALPNPQGSHLLHKQHSTGSMREPATEDMSAMPSRTGGQQRHQLGVRPPRVLWCEKRRSFLAI